MMDNYIENYVAVIKKYVMFEGRANKREFWMFVLASLIISIALSIVDGAFGFHRGDMKFFSSLYSLFAFLPSLSVGVRRLHDTNRSGWWALIMLLPIVGAIVLIVFATGDSFAGDNKYGPNPNNKVEA